MPTVLAEPLTACAAAVLCAAGPTAAPDTALTLTSTGPGGNTSAVTLHCDPPAGTHPAPDTACTALAEAKGDFANLPARQDACVLIYAPVEVRAYGTWQGNRVDFHAQFPNACVAAAESSGVFAFET